LCPTWSGYAPVFVAQDLGYFKTRGVDVDIKFEDERPNVMAAMARGDIEMDMRTVGEYQGKPRDAKTPGIIIGTIDQSLGGDGVIAPGDITSVEQLKGKTVASKSSPPPLRAWSLSRPGKSLPSRTWRSTPVSESSPHGIDPTIVLMPAPRSELPSACHR
jgi:NitT/TauT family transport system substrate-binding protein